MTLFEAYEKTLKTLEEHKLPEPGPDTYLLLEKLCGASRSDIHVHGDRELSPEQEKDLKAAVDRRLTREPLQQILGETEFMGLPFIVSNQVLCPRQDTEILVEEVMRYLHDGYRILDLCTGSGCILLSLLHYSNDIHGIGVDLSENALEVAEKNRLALKLEEKSLFLQGDLFAALEKAPEDMRRFEIITSNPPYIPTADIEDLMPEVRDHEPHLALDGEADGLLFYRRIIPEALKFLCGGGMLFFEIGANQAEAVSGLMKDAGYRDVYTLQDLGGHDRVVVGTKY